MESKEKLLELLNLFKSKEKNSPYPNFIKRAIRIYEEELRKC